MHPVTEQLVQLFQQGIQTVAGLGAGQQDVRVKVQGIGLVTLVVNGQTGDVGTVQPVQDLISNGQLFFPLVVARVRHPHDDIRPCGFLQRGFEGLHQIVGQAGDKADRVHQQNGHAAGQNQLPAGGVQGGKQHVGLGHAGAAQGIHQAGFAHVGVTHKADHRHPGLGPGLAALAPALFHLSQLFGQCVDAGVDVAAVQLQLGLTGTTAGTTTAAATAALAAQAFAHSLQAGQTVAQKRQLGLQLALVGHGAAAEDLQNQHGAVNDLHAAQRRGDVADLAAGQLAVKHGTLGTQLRGGSGGLLQLAAAQHDAGLGGLPLLGHGCHSLHVVGLAECSQLVQAALTVPKPLIQGQ